MFGNASGIEMIVVFIVTLAATLATPVLLFIGVRKLMRERGGTDVAALRSDMQRLEGDVADLALENDRLREAQRFRDALDATRKGNPARIDQP